ncbi:ATP-binding protein [Butyrivibrio sp. YAB3001]|uniref:ATP-binding protein n=1 Tax=Butyrivibrio sp. YAB3001 TaxID=1520812 RepID=UPI002E8E297A|nr:ATP-binding protein [Butyrivibrio sp. YAB3001]
MSIIRGTHSKGGLSFTVADGCLFCPAFSHRHKACYGDLKINLTDDARLMFSNSSANLSTVDVNKLFDRFFTVENALSSSTGLGLSIVKIFAERMNCSVKADYEDGKLIIEVDF